MADFIKCTDLPFSREPALRIAIVGISFYFTFFASLNFPSVLYIPRLPFFSTLDKVADYLNGLACQKYPPKNELDKLPVLKIKELRNGLTGLKIIEDICKGNLDPFELAKHRHYNCRKSEEEIVKALPWE